MSLTQATSSAARRGRQARRLGSRAAPRGACRRAPVSLGVAKVEPCNHLSASAPRTEPPATESWSSPAARAAARRAAVSAQELARRPWWSSPRSRGGKDGGGPAARQSHASPIVPSPNPNSRLSVAADAGAASWPPDPSPRARFGTLSPRHWREGEPVPPLPAASRALRAPRGGAAPPRVDDAYLGGAPPVTAPPVAPSPSCG
jgi:hypothetical protein